MVDPGHMFRRALSWLPDNFVSLDHQALNAPPRFSSTDHLSVEAVAAYVDGELPMKAHLRAAGHLGRCPQCSAEVDALSAAVAGGAGQRVGVGSGQRRAGFPERVLSRAEIR